jgi:hypothetical protein
MGLLHRLVVAPWRSLMRITAKLDPESEYYIELIRSRMGLKTVADVLSYSLREVATRLKRDSKPGDRMQALLDSDYVGSFDGDVTPKLSSDYKFLLGDYLDEKFPQRPAD